MTPEQCRAARYLLDPPWSRDDLAAAAGISLMTVRRFEQDIGPVSDEAIDKLRAALEKAGVAFISVGETSTRGGQGVRIGPKPKG